MNQKGYLIVKTIIISQGIEAIRNITLANHSSYYRVACLLQPIEEFSISFDKSTGLNKNYTQETFLPQDML